MPYQAVPGFAPAAYGVVAPAVKGGGKGKAKGAGLGVEDDANWGVPGLTQALIEVLNPIQIQEPTPVADLANKIHTKVKKICDKYQTDERCKERATATTAQGIIEEFVECIMGTLHTTCYEKPWFTQVSFTSPLLMCAIYTFSEAKIFTRTLKPQLVKHIENANFKWQEEQRVTAAIWDTVVISGILESHQKKANAHLTKSYDDAHFKAPYGSTTAASPEIGVLQDFVKGWMSEFLGRAWDVLESGLVDTSRESQVATVTGLYQTLMDPNVACIPYEIAAEITNAGGTLPAAPWAFIEEAAAEAFIEMEQAAAGPKKKMKKGW